MGIDDLVSKAKDLAGKAKDVGGDLAEKGKEVAGKVAEDAREVTDIARGEGTIGDKAKAAVQAIKEPGPRDGEAPPPPG